MVTEASVSAYKRLPRRYNVIMGLILYLGWSTWRHVAGCRNKYTTTGSQTVTRVHHCIPRSLEVEELAIILPVHVQGSR